MRAAAFAAVLALVALPTPSPAPPSRFRAVTFPAGPSPRWITVSDVNHDGYPDLLIADAPEDRDGFITVLLGDGRGNFHPAPGAPVPAGHLPNDIAVADMNGDSHPDLIIANHQSPYVRILLGDGTGRFDLAPGSPVDVHSYPHPHAVVAADFNSDGRPDVATDSWGNNQIELLLGDGAGRLLTPGTFFPTGRRPYERLRSADFNHDGHPDIVTTNLDDGTVSILLSDGHGHFTNAPGSPFPAGAKPWEVALADIDGDGNTDLIVIPYQRDISGPPQNIVTVLYGDGHGAFHSMPGPPLSLGDCRGPNSVAAGDLTGSDRPTIVVACAESHTLMLYDRAANGSFTASSMPIAGGWGSVAIARLTSDPRAALLTANADDATITIDFPR
ncbi:MAG: VCBS repeat-containing protein [Acidobacteriaceae bacterium]